MGYRYTEFGEHSLVIYGHKRPGWKRVPHILRSRVELRSRIRASLFVDRVY